MGNFILGIIIGGAFLFYYLVNGGSDNSTENTNTNTEVNLEWVSPTEDVCTSHGGELYEGTCRANWQTAKDICEASGTRLPTKDEFSSLITSCGGVVNYGELAFDISNGNIDNKNKGNSSYESCYKNKDFNSLWYWSSTSSNMIFALIVSLEYGNLHGYYKDANNFIMCVR